MQRFLLAVLLFVFSVNMFAQEVEEEAVYGDSAVYKQMVEAELKKMLGGVFALPDFSEDSSANAKKAKMEEFANEVLSRNDLTTETYYSPLMLSAVLGIDMEKETIFRIVYSSYLEHAIYVAMGGKNESAEGIGQALSALRLSINDALAPDLQRYPEKYCSVIDSVAVFIKRLDYIGNNYPEEKELKSKEEQAEIVDKLNGLEDLKSNIRKSAEVFNVVSNCMNALYLGKDNSEISKYMTEELCEKVKSKKIKLADFSPRKEWKEWNAKDKGKCSLSTFEEGSYLVLLSETPIENSDTDNEPSDYRSFVIYVQEVGKEIKISEIKENPYLN